jgi:hypothetical protein
VSAPLSPAFACPCCGTVSHHPEDVAHGYCARCHWWTGDPELGPAHIAGECAARAARAAVIGEHRACETMLNGAGYPCTCDYDCVNYWLRAKGYGAP